MCKQYLPLRGHREGPISDNRGNFLEILNVVANHDPIVQRKLTQGPRNPTYTLGDMLDIMAEAVRSKITTNIKKAGIYAFIQFYQMKLETAVKKSSSLLW